MPIHPSVRNGVQRYFLLYHAVGIFNKVPYSMFDYRIRGIAVGTFMIRTVVRFKNL